MAEKTETAVEEKKEAKKTTKAKKADGGSKVADIIESVKNMTVMELSELVKTLEEEFGVTAAAPMAMAMPAAGGGAAVEAEVEEQTEFDVVLTSFGSNKIQVIKVVRTLTGLGLKEAKDLVDGSPSTVKEGIAKDEAAKVQKELEDVGATAELK